MSDDTENTTDVTVDNIKEIANSLVPQKPPTSMEQIEGTLADFFKNTIQIASEKNDFQKQIEDEVLKRLPSFNETQILALLTNSQINFNDYVSKIVSPTMQLASAKQQAEIAAKREQMAHSNTGQPNNIRDLNQQVPGDVLAGMKHLGDFLNTIATNNQNSLTKNVTAVDAEVIKDKNKEDI